MTGGLAVPVAMFVFNRPDTTARVLDAVRRVRPRRLLVIADGPRLARDGEAQRCEEVRALFGRIDWQCEVERDFAPQNLGCRSRLSSGLDWVFDRVEEAIVLEDDCLPDPTFFPYCEALLARYRHEPRVMAITGDNFQEGRRRGTASYYFSRFMHVWGWASWRRAWRHYDVTLADWPSRRETGWLEEVLGSVGGARAWKEIFDRTRSGAVDTWDYQWVYAIWAQSGLVATPNVNLVSNIGAGRESTHPGGRARFFHMRTEPMSLPPLAPPAIAADDAADRFVQRMQFTRPLSARLAALVRRVLRP
jgi:hypothetical protein